MTPGRVRWSTKLLPPIVDDWPVQADSSLRDLPAIRFRVLPVINRVSNFISRTINLLRKKLLFVADYVLTYHLVAGRLGLPRPY
jgi:hypothetical protein